MLTKFKPTDKNGLAIKPGDRVTALHKGVTLHLRVLEKQSETPGSVWVEMVAGQEKAGMAVEAPANLLELVVIETENQTAKAVGNAAKICAECVVGIVGGLLFGTARALSESWKEANKPTEPKNWNPQLPTRCAPVEFSRPGGLTGNIFIINGGNVTINNF